MAKIKSPNYPAIGLSESINLIRKLWDKEKKTAVTPEVAVTAIGYVTLNGPARTKLSALKKYGLVIDDRHGVRVSDLAMRILHNQEGSEYYKKAVLEAALKPEIFAPLFQSFADASDDALKSHLMVNMEFSEIGAKNFIASFRDTLALAKLSGLSYNPSEKKQEEIMEPIAEREQGRRGALSQMLMNSFPIPLMNQNQATITFNRLPVEKPDLDLLKKWIDLMINNLTEKPTTEGGS
jgi:hypothetical protein